MSVSKTRDCRKLIPQILGLEMGQDPRTGIASHALVEICMEHSRQPNMNSFLLTFSAAHSLLSVSNLLDWHRPMCAVLGAKGVLNAPALFALSYFFRCRGQSSALGVLCFAKRIYKSESEHPTEHKCCI